MHVVAIAWIFVVVLMAAAEATAPNGTVLGALFTLLLYGALPLSIVMYVLGTPMRRRKRQQAEALAASQAAAEAAPATAPPEADSEPPDGRSMASGDTLAPERKEA